MAEQTTTSSSAPTAPEAPSTALRTVLVANRGEIALRVFRTARRLGLRTVALFTELDARAPHVRAADHAVQVPDYLDIEAVVAAAQSAGADVVHPGYGFLSERSAFSNALAAAGIRLAGPSGTVMEQMGRKDAAREIAVAANVPVVPSYSLDDDPAGFNYPVLVKAAAGGGGKGMRVCRSAADFPEAVAAARREAQSSFGDDTLLIEKYVESGRHLEVQVMADDHGTTLHLWERDCSTQRRHQKVLEEAPAPTIDAETRARLTASAVDLARAVDYRGAGTVEFLFDTDSGEFYFLEMNTRLQVEHPVTEAITGFDLVEMQLRVAAGLPLGVAQEDVPSNGWAIEARVYAEDAFGGFLPQAGTATHVHWPHEGGSAEGALGAVPSVPVRVDHALESGQEVSTSYDPMLGKVIVHGPDREAARKGLVSALDRTAVLGLTTNTGFLRTLLAGEEFRDATIDTAWLDKNEVEAPGDEQARTLAAWVAASLAQASSSGPFASDGFRPGGVPAPFRVELDRPVSVSFDATDPSGTSGTVDGEAVREIASSVRAGAGDSAAGALLSGTQPGGVVQVEVAGASAADGPVIGFVKTDRHGAEVVVRGQRYRFDRPDPTADASATGEDSVLAPMPGTVLEVRVSAGETVEEGAVLGVMEAMKMEMALKAPHAGTVTAVDTAVGDQVALGARLFEVEADAGEGSGEDAGAEA
ncbi:acetyl/propionyl/methylcrotonyl-CoA carboxylase subunit alpha [Brevibacterium litoralis]|uniref:acetyl/propionyl/methylcrotonyl-CoA carboxylase subunit alpha n=1 Tax=Brevibacterium litoralis TaxID=3138935 RepID=UPI0032EC48A4